MHPAAPQPVVPVTPRSQSRQVEPANPRPAKAERANPTCLHLGQYMETGMTCETLYDRSTDIMFNPNDVGHFQAPKKQKRLTAVGIGLQFYNDRRQAVVSVQVNGSPSIRCPIDSGATQVLLLPSVVDELWKTRFIVKGDIIGQSESRLADGNRVPTWLFNVRELKLGDANGYWVRVDNVLASTTNRNKKDASIKIGDNPEVECRPSNPLRLPASVRGSSGGTPAHQIAIMNKTG